MRQSPFGSTILSAVQLNAAAGYDASPIINVVQEIVSQLHDSQSQADNRNSTNQGRCDSNVSQFNRQITETTATIASLHSSIEHNQHSLESDTDSLAQAVRDFDNVTNEHTPRDRSSYYYLLNRPPLILRTELRKDKTATLVGLIPTLK